MIKLDKERQLKYGMKALMLIEDLSQKPISKFNFENVSMKDVCILLHAGLIHEDSGLTFDKSVDLIEEYGMGRFTEIIEKMSEAINKAFGTKNV